MLWYFAMLLPDHSVRTCIHSSNQVSSFVRRPLTTPKPWAHGLQGEADLKNIEPAAVLSAFKPAAAYCSQAARWQ